MSMKMIQLPGDNTALLREPDQVPERLRRPMEDATTALMADPELAALLSRGGELDERDPAAVAAFAKHSELFRVIADREILAYVQQWSLELPITLDGLLDLPAATYNALKTACDAQAKGMKAHIQGFEPNPDPESPTSPSTA